MTITFSFIAGEKSGKSEEFVQDLIRIGRSSTNDLMFDPKKDLDASSNHAEVVLENGTYLIIDKNSTNGTYLNGKKVDRAKLSDGDEIEFGRGGPITRVKIGAASVGETRAPRTRVASAVSTRSGKAPVGSQTIAMMINDALEKAKSSERGAVRGTAVFIKEAVNNALTKSTRTFKIGMSLAVVLLIVGIAYLAYTGSQKEKELREEIEAQKQVAKEAQSRADQAVRMAEEEKDRFYNIAKAYHDSVVFIYSETAIYDRKGKIASVVQGFGTGFIVRDDGYIVTSKHIIYPWKFNDDEAYIVALAKSNNLKVETFLSVWVNGVRYRAAGRFSYENSYNTRDGNLDIYAVSEDRMTQAFRKANWRSGIEVEVHKQDNNDIAVLKAIGGPFKSVKLYKGQKPYKQTDEVMVYGFPLGPSIQELANTNASTAFGRVRKIENTIQIDASVLYGNSGGPVFTKDGTVIGVITRQTSENLSECIMIEHAFRLIPGIF